MRGSVHGGYGQRPRGSTMPLAIRSIWSLVALVVSVSVLGPRIGRAATIRVPGDAPTIQAGINLAQSGDDVLVAPGVYYEHGIVLKGGVWVHTEQGPEATIVDAQRLGRGFSASNLAESLTIEGFTIRNGTTSGRGGGIYVLESGIVIRNCSVTQCEAQVGGGIFSWGSEVIEVAGCRVWECFASWELGGILVMVVEPGHGSITDSEVIGNRAGDGGAGIGAGGLPGRMRIERCVVSENVSVAGFGAAGITCEGLELEIRDCVVTRNEHQYYGIAGIGIWDCSGELANCTISHNSGLYFTYAVRCESSIRLERSIISFNACRGLLGSSGSSLRCTDITGNEGGNDFYGQDFGGNFSADPLFCDAVNGDYTLDWASPCLPGNHPNGVDCGLIGAIGAGCGTPPVTGACCFTDDTCVVAEPQDCASQGGSYLGDDTDCDPNPCIPTARESTTWGRMRAGYR